MGKGFLGSANLPTDDDGGFWWAIFQQDVARGGKLPIPLAANWVVETNDKISRRSPLQPSLDNRPGRHEV